MKVAQSCPTLRSPMNYAVHGILQASILEWVAFSFSRGSSQLRDQAQVSHTAGVLYQLSHMGRPRMLEWVAYILSPGDLPDPGIEQGSPALQADSLPTELSGKPKGITVRG